MSTKFLESLRDRDRWLEVVFCLFWGLMAQLSVIWINTQHLDRAPILAMLFVFAFAISGYVRLRRGYWLIRKNLWFDLYIAALKVITSVWIYTAIFRDYYGGFLSDDGVAAVATFAICVMIFVTPKTDLLVTRLRSSGEPISES
jgi:hypothetical protein